MFVNEIVWHYGLGAARGRRRLLTKHDVIFWYAGSPGYTFNLLRDEPTPAMLDKYRHVDEAGNRYMNSYGKRYLLKGGKPLDDVWDIPAIAPTSKDAPATQPRSRWPCCSALSSSPATEVDTAAGPILRQRHDAGGRAAVGPRLDRHRQAIPRPSPSPAADWTSRRRDTAPGWKCRAECRAW